MISKRGLCRIEGLRPTSTITQLAGEGSAFCASPIFVLPIRAAAPHPSDPYTCVYYMYVHIHGPYCLLLIGTCRVCTHTLTLITHHIPSIVPFPVFNSLS